MPNLGHAKLGLFFRVAANLRQMTRMSSGGEESISSDPGIRCHSNCGRRVSDPYNNLKNETRPLNDPHHVSYRTGYLHHIEPCYSSGHGGQRCCLYTMGANSYSPSSCGSRSRMTTVWR
ncbi:hypothetical protein ILYODFUR_019003 [Ilyodon furcidens]|uniref:Uncharacterized protein n=1 Tax=Ilyodon furcidens TaxID=33524 RepID=A0ABV0SY97_9TELE